MADRTDRHDADTRNPRGRRTDAAAPRPGRDDQHALAAVTICLPGDTLYGPEIVVRPALAVLFRVAVGPAADRYVRRFLAFERGGRPWPGWHWPSLLVPAFWAFYRKLWVSGFVFALLPLAGAYAFLRIAPQFDPPAVVWWAGLAFAAWLLPGIVAALCANTLLYRQVRRAVAVAERTARSATGAVQRLAQRSPTSRAAALLLGGGALAAVLAVLAPRVQDAYVDLGVRSRVAATLEAARAVEHDIEATWASTRWLPRPSAAAALRALAGATLVEDLDINPVNGRVRLGLGAAVPELAGKTILLAPSRDARERVLWTCIPIGIAPRYLPKECRG